MMPFVYHWKVSQCPVLEFLQLLSTNPWQQSLYLSTVQCNLKLFLKSSILKSLKQSKSLSSIIISRIRVSSSTRFRSASIPSQKRSVNLMQLSEFWPPIRSRYSSVNLKGEDQKFRLPGAMPKMKPKSMWMMLPSMSSRMLPLCLSLSFSTQVRMEEPTSDLMKHSLAFSTLSWNTSWKNLEILMPSDFFFISSTEMELDTNSKMPEFQLSTMISQGFMKASTPASRIMSRILYIICMQMISCLRSSPPFTTTFLNLRLLNLLKFDFMLYLSFFSYHAWPQMDSIIRLQSLNSPQMQVSIWLLSFAPVPFTAERRDYCGRLGYSKELSSLKDISDRLQLGVLPAMQMASKVFRAYEGLMRYLVKESLCPTLLITEDFILSLDLVRFSCCSLISSFSKLEKKFLSSIQGGKVHDILLFSQLSLAKMLSRSNLKCVNRLSTDSATSLYRSLSSSGSTFCTRLNFSSGCWS